MNDNTDHPIEATTGALPRHPVSQNLARKSYIAAWKAAHPDRQREYSRRWKLKQGRKVGSRKWLSHDESLQKMREIPQPFSAKQFALHTGITHGGACNLFKALKEAGKIQVIKKLRWARFYEICSSVPLVPGRDNCPWSAVSNGDLAESC
jgi:hypothetical protein